MPTPYDNVAGTSSTTGQGSLTVSGAVTGFRTLAAELPDGASVAYKAQTEAGAWEKGHGTWTDSGTSLSRDTVHQNSLGTTAKIDFTDTITVYIVDDASMVLTAAERAKLAATSGTNTGDQTLASLGLDADLATFSLPASTTISAFGASLIDDADATAARATLGVGTGSGDASGPASSTDNAIARFDSTTGKVLQNSGITIADGESGTLSGTNTGDQSAASLGLVIGTNVQAHSSVLDATTASFTTADETKLDQYGAVGTTLCANASADIVLVTQLVDFDGNPATSFDGLLVQWLMRYPDNTTAGYEQGWGIYTHSTKTIARTTFGLSSAGTGVGVNWGSSAPKRVTVTLPDTPLAQDLAAVVTAQPWWDELTGCTGQSNASFFHRYKNQSITLPTATPLFVDWGKVAAGTGSPLWQTVDASVTFSGLDSANAQIGATGRRTADPTVSGGPLRYMGHAANAFCRRRAFLTGRKQRLINVARPSTAIDDATYGWLYQPTNTDNTAYKFKAEVDAAITAMISDDPRQTGNNRLHNLIWIHGENNTDTSWAVYGHQLFHLLKAFEHGWNITSADTRHFLVMNNQDSRDINYFGNQFGHALTAELMGPNTVVVDTVNTETYDNLHTYGEGSDEIGYRCAAIRAATGAQPAGGSAAPPFRLKRAVIVCGDYGGTRLADDSTPTSAQQHCFASSRTKYRCNITMYDYINAANVDVSALGLKWYKYGDILSLYNNFTAIGTSAFHVTLLSPAVDHTTYLEWDCSVVEVGTGPAVSSLTYFTSRTDIDAPYTDDDRNVFFDGVSYRYSSEYDLEFPHLANLNADSIYAINPTDTAFQGTNQDVILPVVRADGLVSRSATIPIELVTSTADGTTAGVVYIIGLETGYTHSYDLLVVGANYTSNVYYQFRITGSGRLSGTTYTVMNYTVETIHNPDSVTIPVVAASGLILGSRGLKVSVYGKASSDVYWDISGVVRGI